MPMTAKDRYTVDEYLAFERGSDVKHEYVNGEIIAMAGASPEHGSIQADLHLAIGKRLSGRRCRTFLSDTRVRIDTTGLYAYPDLTVVCGRPQFSDEKPASLLNPTVIFEVLSESTEAYDRGEKTAHYRHHASVQAYVLLSSTAERVEVYRRGGDGWWQLGTFDGDVSVPLSSLEIDVPLSEIYEGWRALRDG